MRLTIPRLSLVFMVGPAGCGKSTFAGKHFKPTEVISSDYCRALVSDREANQSASADAFDVLRYIAAKRLRAGKLTVVDATNVQRKARASLLRLARRLQVPSVAIVLDLPENTCLERNKARLKRVVPVRAIRKQAGDLRISLPVLEGEGFCRVYVLKNPAEVDAAKIARLRPSTPR